MYSAWLLAVSVQKPQCTIDIPTTAAEIGHGTITMANSRPYFVTDCTQTKHTVHGRGHFDEVWVVDRVLIFDM